MHHLRVKQHLTAHQGPQTNFRKGRASQRKGRASQHTHPRAALCIFTSALLLQAFVQAFPFPCPSATALRTLTPMGLTAGGRICSFPATSDGTPIEAYFYVPTCTWTIDSVAEGHVPYPTAAALILTDVYGMTHVYAITHV